MQIHRLCGRYRKGVMTEHLRDVRLGKNKPISFHLGIKGHTQNDMAFAVLERMYGGRASIKRRHLDQDVINSETRYLQCERQLHSSSNSVRVSCGFLDKILWLKYWNKSCFHTTVYIIPYGIQLKNLRFKFLSRTPYGVLIDQKRFTMSFINFV